MKIAFTSDLHGNLPLIQKNINLLCISGDICPDFSSNSERQEEWLSYNFKNWVSGLNCKVVLIAGNHDFFKSFPYINNVFYLQDSGVTLDNIKIWGTPWCLPIWGNWNKSELGLAHSIYSKIPENTDILLSHGPPFGIRDLCVNTWETEKEPEHVGSKSLLTIIEKIKPKIVSFGHIHECYGVTNKIYGGKEVKFINGSLCNRAYNPVNYPIIIDLYIL